MAQFDFDKMKEKVLATAGRAADKSVELAKIAGDKAKLAGRITRLRTEVAMEKDSLRKMYTELGKLYYDDRDTNAQAEKLLQAVEEITLAREAINAKSAEALALKKMFSEDFGKAKEKAEEAVEEVVEVIEEKVEEAVEAVEEKQED